MNNHIIPQLPADRKIPAGRAAPQLGLRRPDFVELLRHRSIPYVIYTAEDFDEDMKTIDRLQLEIERNLKESGAGRLK